MKDRCNRTSEYTHNDALKYMDWLVACGLTGSIAAIGYGAEKNRIMII